MEEREMHEDKEVLEKRIELEQIKLERMRYEVLMRLMETTLEWERRKVELLTILARSIDKQMDR